MITVKVKTISVLSENYSEKCRITTVTIKTIPAVFRNYFAKFRMTTAKPIITFAISEK